MDVHQRILLVDDEPQLARILHRNLSGRGYEVQMAAEGEEALVTFRSWIPDLVVTDLVMPNMGGLELCRRLRAISSVPIIVLSIKSDESIKVEAFSLGADDYVTKPFGMDEFIARVQAALRRPQLFISAEGKIIQAGDFLVNLDKRRVTVQGREVHLTPKEYELLLYLIRHPDKVLPHRVLLSAVWGGNYVEQTKYLRVFVGNLRKKIEPDPNYPRYIFTEPWTGYRFNGGA
ncbi:MAG: response regulator transcription factor [Blastocatellia bacterium]|nr:response regulator transcription factor [Blastocatellia bacterium]